MPEMTTDVEWDPTGRYVVACVSAWSGKVVREPITVQLTTHIFVGVHCN